MENVNLISIDIAKSTFHIRAVNHSGRALLDRKARRDEVLKVVLSMPRKATVVMESCGTAHFWGRTFQQHGYEVKLIAPQFVKPFVKSHKNDKADAEAIAEAASRSSMRFVQVKTEDQQGIQLIHRIRTRLVRSRTSLANEVRAILAEFGNVCSQGKASLRGCVAKVLEDPNSNLPLVMKQALSELQLELCAIEERIKIYDKQLRALASQNITCKRLKGIPGVGYVGATALFASFGDAKQFKNGRALAASLGLIPNQHSSGGKSKLGRISKRGDKYIRQLLVHGSRAVLKTAHRHQDPYSLWATKLRDTKCYNKASVALANRNARIAWVILSKGEEFSPNKSCTPLAA